MAVDQASITEREIQVCDRVKDLLLELGAGFTPTERPDVLVVTEPETNIPVTVDAEETVVCLRILVCEDKADPALYRRMLEANARIPHGHFQVENGQIVLADNLEAENLDANELEASIASLVTAVVENAEWLD